MPIFENKTTIAAKKKMKKISANPRYHSILYYVSTTLLRNAGKFFSPIFGNFIFAS